MTTTWTSSSTVSTLSTSTSTTGSSSSSTSSGGVGGSSSVADGGSTSSTSSTATGTGSDLTTESVDAGGSSIGTSHLTSSGPPLPSDAGTSPGSPHTSDAGAATAGGGYGSSSTAAPPLGTEGFTTTAAQPIGAVVTSSRLERAGGPAGREMAGTSAVVPTTVTEAGLELGGTTQSITWVATGSRSVHSSSSPTAEWATVSQPEWTTTSEPESRTWGFASTAAVASASGVASSSTALRSSTTTQSTGATSRYAVGTTATQSSSATARFAVSTTTQSTSTSTATHSTATQTTVKSERGPLVDPTPGLCRFAGGASSLGTAGDLAILRVAVAIGGLEPTLFGEGSARSAVLRAVECGIVSVLSDALGVPSVPAELSTELRLQRRLRGSPVRGLQSAGAVLFETDIIPSDPLSIGDFDAALQNVSTVGQSVLMHVNAALNTLGLAPRASSAEVTTGTVTQSKEQQVAKLLAASDAETRSLLGQLSRNQTEATSRLPGGAVAKVAKLSSQGGPRLAVELPETEMKVVIPSSIFEHLGYPAEELALAVVGYGSDGASFGGEESSVQGESRTLLSVVAVSLRLLSGGELTVEGLAVPVNISLPVNYSQGVSCAFWEEDQGWSSRGVRADAAGNAPGRPLVCSTTHFSLFAAIGQGFVNSITCAQFGLITYDGLSQMANGEWYKNPGALMYWSTLSGLALLFAAAALVDMWRNRRHKWSPEFFLVPSPQKRAPVTGEVRLLHSISSASNGDGVKEKSCMCRFVAAVAGCCLAVDHYCKETAMRDALDEVASEWFEQFSEVRSLLEDIWGDLALSKMNWHHLHQLSMTAMSRVIISASSQLAASELSLSLEVVTFVLKEEVLVDVVTHRHFLLQVQKIDPRPTGAHWTSIEVRDDVWAHLHADVVSCIERFVKGCSWRNFLRYVKLMSVVNCPLVRNFSQNIFMSCKMRCLFYAMEVIGALFVVCIFFAASGKLKGRPSFGGSAADCAGSTLKDEIWYKIGRAFAIAIGSAIFAGLPVAVLQAMHTRGFRKLEMEGSEEWVRQLKAWRAQEKIIWTIGITYLAFSSGFIALFLANIADKDHADWMMTAVMSLLWDIVLVPVSMALFLPVLGLSLMTLNMRTSEKNHGHMIRDVLTRLHNQSNVMLPIMAI